MRTHRDRLAGITPLALITIAVSGGSAAAQATAIKSVLPPQINCQGATAREEALIRKQIQIMHPEVTPLRVIFVPHWKYVELVPADITSQKGACSMFEQDHLKIAKETLAAVNARDLDGFVSYLDESHVWENEGFPAPIQGRVGARQVLGAYLEAFPDLRFETECTIANGDFVVTCWCMTGTHKAQFRGPGALDIPPTNKQFRVRGCTVSEFKNGRVARTVDYSDRLAVLRQLGVPPVGKPAAAAS